MSNTFSIIGLIAESTLKLINYPKSKVFGNPILEKKVGLKEFGLGLIFLQKLRMFFNDFFNLVLVCKDIEPRYVRTRTRGFLSIE